MLGPNGYLYVANITTQSIGLYTTTGVRISDSLINGLAYPAAMAFDANGNLYVVDVNNNRIGEYRLSGTPINPSFISGLDAPSGLMILVPEPSCFGFLALGATFVALRRRSGSRR